jgi:FKBP-type peptidyl-prolyl cis-trans isomerase 2
MKGDGEMKDYAEKGDRVTLHFTAKTERDDIFATTAGENPVEFTIG